MMRLPVIAFFCCAAVAAAAEETRPPAGLYRDIMAAQLAARDKPRPMRADEARAIYQSYLESIGRPARQSTSSSTGPDPSR